MKLRSKTSLFSIGLALSIVLAMMLYLFLLLPSIYISQKRADAITDTRDLHLYFVEHKKSRTQQLFNGPTVHAYLKKDENTIRFRSIFFDFDYQITIPKLLEAVNDFRNSYPRLQDVDWKKVKDVVEDIIQNIAMLKGEKADAFSKLLSNVDLNKNLDQFYREQKMKVIDNDTILLASRMTIESIDYISHSTLTYKDGDIYLTFSNILQPQVSEIFPVLISGAPLIILTILLISLIFSAVFAQKIVRPVEKISQHVALTAKIETKEKLELDSQDEFAFLAAELNQLYERLHQQNLDRRSQQKQRELFLQANAHQLKTPLASALLLTQGMIDEIPPFCDRDKYLGELKSQLMTMSLLISQTLEITQKKNNPIFADVIVENVLFEQVKQNRALLAEKQLQFELVGHKTLHTDLTMISMICANLFINAVFYTDRGGKITVKLDEECLVLRNSPARIDFKKLAQIGVAYKENDKVRGLGLYLVHHYAHELNMQFEILNEDDAVISKLYFK